MRQIIYTSVAVTGFDSRDLGPILFDARFYNRRRGVTGLLLFDGKCFLQALEGDAPDVGATFSWVRKDKRHRAITLVADRTVAVREFGNWNMATKIGEAIDYNKGVAELVSQVTCPKIKETFLLFCN